MKKSLTIHDAKCIMEGIDFALFRMGINDLDLLEKKSKEIFIDYCNMKEIINIVDEEERIYLN